MSGGSPGPIVRTYRLQQVAGRTWAFPGAQLLGRVSVAAGVRRWLDGRWCTLGMVARQVGEAFLSQAEATAAIWRGQDEL